MFLPLKQFPLQIWQIQSVCTCGAIQQLRGQEQGEKGSAKSQRLSTGRQKFKKKTLVIKNNHGK
jgi:hypothetical protein